MCGLKRYKTLKEKLFCPLITPKPIGNPTPTLVWYQTGILELIIDDLSTINSTGVVINDLKLRKLDRKDYRTRLTCRASSNALYDPIETHVIIDMNCKSSQKNEMLFEFKN